MRVRLSTVLIVVALECVLLAAALPLVRELRYARMRANCVNALKQQVVPPISDN